MISDWYKPAIRVLQNRKIFYLIQTPSILFFVSPYKFFLFIFRWMKTLNCIWKTLCWKSCILFHNDFCELVNTILYNWVREQFFLTQIQLWSATQEIPVLANDFCIDWKGVRIKLMTKRRVEAGKPGRLKVSEIEGNYFLY